MVHKVVNLENSSYICRHMEKAFIYGMSVGGGNFTDRVKETARIRLDFENGINVILISPRRMGKTSLIKKVFDELDSPEICPVYMDIYDCRNEYDFYNRYAATILKATSGKMDQLVSNVRSFLSRVSPRISFGTDPTQEFSLSLGITPRDYEPEEILNLPERIAKEKGIRIVVCIDEFQQVGEFADSLTVQKRLRGTWQHHQNVSFCLTGSKKHLMQNFFQSKRMPFYQFGEVINLGCIPTGEWVEFICSRFRQFGKTISKTQAEAICRTVGGQSSYVQQLAWNVMAETKGDSVSEESLQAGIDALLRQCDAMFVQQTERLTAYQMNFVRALCGGLHGGFGGEKVTSEYRLGSKSNIDRIKKSLLEREMIEINREGVFLSDAVFALWFRRYL